MQVGDVVVVTKRAPARFKNLKPGSLWKVVALRGLTPQGITVGDAQHQSIKTDPGYFLVLDNFTKDQIRNTGNYTGSNLSVRLDAIEAFKPELKSNNQTFTGYVRVKVNGVRAYFARNVADALSARYSDKLVQAKLIRKLGGL